MRFTKIQTWADDNNVIVKVDVKESKDGVVLKSLTLHMGKQYRVEPSDSRKKKNKGRTGKVVEFREDDGTYAILKFDDTKRSGRVDLEDLVEI